jgi:hypothetical protein
MRTLLEFYLMSTERYEYEIIDMQLCMKTTVEFVSIGWTNIINLGMKVMDFIK